MGFLHQNLDGFALGVAKVIFLPQLWFQMLWTEILLSHSHFHVHQHWPMWTDRMHQQQPSESLRNVSCDKTMMIQILGVQWYCSVCHQQIPSNLENSTCFQIPQLFPSIQQKFLEVSKGQVWGLSTTVDMCPEQFFSLLKFPFSMKNALLWTCVQLPKPCKRKKTNDVHVCTQMHPAFPLQWCWIQPHWWGRLWHWSQGRHGRWWREEISRRQHEWQDWMGLRCIQSEWDRYKEGIESREAKTQEKKDPRVYSCVPCMWAGVTAQWVSQERWGSTFESRSVILFEFGSGHQCTGWGDKIQDKSQTDGGTGRCTSPPPPPPAPLPPQHHTVCASARNHHAYEHQIAQTGRTVPAPAPAYSYPDKTFDIQIPFDQIWCHTEPNSDRQSCVLVICSGSADSGDRVVLYVGGQTFICLQPPVSPTWSEVSTVLYEDLDMKDVCWICCICLRDQLFGCICVMSTQFKGQSSRRIQREREICMYMSNCFHKINFNKFHKKKILCQSGTQNQTGWGK